MAELKNMVILVDEKDRKIGLEEKLKAHQNGGKLHRAISVFVFNSHGAMMLQQRAFTKYHTQGLWSNTCCSHPFDGESNSAAGHRRLKEEMGFDCDLKEITSFIYHAEVGNNLKENEYDHVFVGIYNGVPIPNEEEVASWKLIDTHELIEDININPENYTPWFKIILPRVLEWSERKLPGKL